MKATTQVFVSHCSEDKPLANALCKLLAKCLEFTDDQIRCTSIDKYKLAPGSNFPKSLIDEISTAPVFLVLLTESSLRSQYVLLETGARWGQQLIIVPILCDDLLNQLQPPFSELNCIKRSDDLDGLLRDVARRTGRDYSPAQETRKYVSNFQRMNIQRIQFRDVELTYDSTSINIIEVDHGYVDLHVKRDFELDFSSGGTFPYELTLDHGEWKDSCSLERKKARGTLWHDLDLKRVGAHRAHTIRLPAVLHLDAGDRIKGHLESTERFEKSRGFYQLQFRSRKSETKFLWESTLRWAKAWDPATLEAFYFSDDLALEMVEEGVTAVVGGSNHGINYVLRWRSRD